MLRRLQKVEKLPPTDQRVVLKLVDGLLEKEYRATRLHSSGGFLKQSNATIVLGVEDDRIDDVMAIIAEHCTSRTQVVRSISATRARLLDEAADVAAKQQVGQLLGALGEALEVRQGRLPPLLVSRTQGRCDRRLDESALAVGRGAEGA